jgi:rod shape-determining protein MreC
MDFFTRHRNPAVLVLALFLQVVGLAVQVKQPTDRGPVRLVRLWGISLMVPLERAVVQAESWVHQGWSDYFYLRNVRRENRRLQEQNLRLRLELVRLTQDAGQAQRLQALFRFKEQFISDTVAAQVIGTSGSENSRLLYIDKGSSDGLKPDMAVITPEGIVGKVIRVFPASSQVLEINDQASGVGALLEKARLQGILKGAPGGGIMVHYIMSDERVERGEPVVTSGGDRIFPKGLLIGWVQRVDPGPEMFLNIRVKPAASLDRVEEVLVITRIDERQPEMIPEMPLRAADILAERLPSVPVKPPAPATSPAGKPAAAPGGAATSAAAGVSGSPVSGTPEPTPGNRPAGPPVPKKAGTP